MKQSSVKQIGFRKKLLKISDLYKMTYHPQSRPGRGGSADTGIFY